MGIRSFPANNSLFGGTGSDAAFEPSVNYNFDDAEGSWVIKEYSSIIIPNGVTVSTDNRIKGLILYCSGDVTINGEIDLDGLGYGSEQFPPILYDRYYSAGTLTSAWAKYCSGLDGETLVKGGDGGGGGGRGNTGATIDGANGAHAGASGLSSSAGSGANASNWAPGVAVGDATYSVGSSLNAAGQRGGTGTQFGGAAYIGVQNAGGNAGQGGTSSANGTNAALTTSAASVYGGPLLVIIAKGAITLGSTANIHCDGGNGPDIDSENGCDGAGGGGCIVLMSQGSQSIDGSATQSVDGGAGGTNSGYGGNGGDGDSGAIVNQVVV